MKTTFTLNGREVSWEHAPGEMLFSILRREGHLPMRNACDGEGTCGLCTVLLDGRSVSSCLVLAAQAEGHAVTTVAAYGRERALSVVQQALLDVGAVQCGYCTPSVVLALHSLLDRSHEPSDAEITDALSGILCRCTGYKQFYQAARLASRRLSEPGYAEQVAPEFRAELRHVGKVREKVDARSLVRGERAYVEDRVEPGACVLLMLGSPHAHALIKRIEVSKALALPGVIEILTHENTPQTVYCSAGQGYPEPSPYDRRMFGRRVRHVGDRVAAVLAESREAAQAAIAAIEVEYEVLPAILSVDEAAAPNAPILHSGEIRYLSGGPPGGSSVDGDGSDDPIIYPFPIGADPHRNLAASASGGVGDVAKGFTEADEIVEREYVATQVHTVPMEPHVVYTKMEGGRLVIHASTQVSWHLRRIVARVLGIPENKIHVVKERVGGGFGVKQDVVLEEVAAYLTWKTGRSVFYRYSREEEFLASRTRHPMKIAVRLGARRDGALTAIEMRVRANTGAYGQHCLTVPMNACSKTLPLLPCANVHYDIRTYYSNAPVAGAYQGYGATQGTFALMTALAELAEKLGLDPLAMIEKNRVRTGDRLEILASLGEGRAGQAMTIEQCSLGDALEAGRREFGWEERPPRAGARQAEAGAGAPAGREAIDGLPDGDWRLGRGAAIIQQGSGLPGIDLANAEIKLLTDGTFLLLSGGADIGTGLDTVTVKVSAEALCVDMKDIAIISGDTDTTPFDKGAYASSGTFYSGNAALSAARNLKAKLIEAGAVLLGEAAADCELAYPGAVRGRKGAVSFAAIAQHAVSGDGAGELSAVGTFTTLHSAIPYGAHFVEVAVNVRSGEVKVRRYYVYQDSGTPINPDLALGQIYGAVVKSVGHSLYEEMILDDMGRCRNPNLQDYRVPSVFEVPEDMRATLIPTIDPVGPFGGKSISEVSMNGAAPAIACAIHDAVGAWVRTWPFTPERVLAALSASGGGAGEPPTPLAWGSVAMNKEQRK